jgi:putative DNA primase/helicase
VKSFADFGITLPAGAHGEIKLTCPECSHARKKRNFPCLNVNLYKGIWHCWHCGWSGGLAPGAAAMSLTRTPPRASKEQRGFTGYAAGIWSESIPITPASVAGRYLLGRRCALPPADSDLRWHPGLKHTLTGRTFPALVGLITHAEDYRRRLGLHRTYLAADGTGKAAVGELHSAKMTLCRPLQLGCIRLWPDERVDDRARDRRGRRDRSEPCVGLRAGVVLHGRRTLDGLPCARRHRVVDDSRGP